MERRSFFSLLFGGLLAPFVKPKPETIPRYVVDDELTRVAIEQSLPPLLEIRIPAAFSDPGFVSVMVPRMDVYVTAAEPIEPLQAVYSDSRGHVIGKNWGPGPAVAEAVERSVPIEGHPGLHRVKVRIL